MTVMFFRTIIIYFLLLLVLKLMGKRQIGELQPSELVTTLLLSEIASQPVTDDNIPLVYGVVPVVVVLAVEVIISYLITRNKKLKDVFLGKPSVLIERGVIRAGEMRRVRLTVEELMSQLRQKDVPDISQVYYAIMEPNGKISVFTVTSPPEGQKEPGIARAVICDGRIERETLKAAGKDEAWLYKQLEPKKLKPEEIFLMTCDDAGTIYIVKNKDK